MIRGEINKSYTFDVVVEAVVDEVVGNEEDEDDALPVGVAVAGVDRTAVLDVDAAAGNDLGTVVDVVDVDGDVDDAAAESDDDDVVGEDAGDTLI